MKINMDLLKSLRDISQAPLKDCKDALIESNWDLERAQELLKSKWMSNAAKKADRQTNEWVVKAIKKNVFTIWIKLWCETDFVAKSDIFLSLVDNIIEILNINWHEFDSIDEISDFVEIKINPIIQENIWKIWENIKLLNAFVRKWNSYIYLHPWNKIFTVLFYEWVSDENIAKELALQITAMNPIYKSIEEIPTDFIESMKLEFEKDLQSTWKSKQVIETIIKWKLLKKFEEIVFYEQFHIRDDSKKIKDIIPNGFKLVDYVRFSI